jgi:glycosyltransferase involved in cell wall biosynthesis
MENKIDIVIPVYNSRLALEQLITSLADFSDDSSYTIHVYFVDDGSVDGSCDYLNSLKLPFAFTTIKLERNYGQHAATAVGLSYCTSSYCVTIDDDLQHNPNDIPLLIEEMNRTGADIIFGKYEQKKHSLIRNLGSWLIKKAVYKDKVEYDDVTSFRLIRLSIAKQFSPQRPPIGFIDEVLLSLARKVSTVRVKHLSAVELKSRYSSIKLVRFALRIVFFHSSFPLRFIIRLGLYSASVFFIIGCYFIYNRFVNEVPLGFSAIIVSIFFTSGIILVALGIIAEYLRKMWEFQQGKEQVFVQEVCERDKTC